MSTPLQSPDTTASTDTTHRTDRWWEELPGGRNRLAGRAHLHTDAPALNLDGIWAFRYGTRAPPASWPAHSPGTVRVRE